MEMILMAAALTWLYLPPFLRVLEKCRLERSNYTGQSIPLSAGLVLAFTITWTVALALLWEWYPSYQAARLLLIVNGFALVGLLDDISEGSDAKGWSGHLRQLSAGTLSTGMVKVLYGGALAVAVAVLEVEMGLDVVLNATLITLGAALFNQLDVRPQRTTVAFLTLTPLLVLGGGWSAYLPVTPVVGAALAYLPFDSKCRAMLGDSGANALGATWGWAAGALPSNWRWTILLVTLALHLLGDKYSLHTLSQRWLGKSRDDQHS